VDAAPLHRVGIANFSIVGRPEPSPDARPMADVSHASPGYFGAIGLHMVAGRDFTDADLPTAAAADERAGVAIVNRAFARQFFAGRNPLGERLRQDDQHSSEIVGVVSDYRAMGTENGERPTIFWPDLRLAHATLLVRGTAAPDAIRDAVWAVDRGLPAAEVKPMQYYVDEWLSQRKFLTLLLVIFAGLALALGLMGIYGVLANAVAARTREIGIRMAIGATPAGIGRMVLRQGMTPVAVGLALGLAASLGMGGLLESLLFQVRPQDPMTLAAAAGSILIFAPLAIALPLRRATRVDTSVALRDE
jgi:putative ABC transport system permease protein